MPPHKFDSNSYGFTNHNYRASLTVALDLNTPRVPSSLGPWSHVSPLTSQPPLHQIHIWKNKIIYCVRIKYSKTQLLFVFHFFKTVVFLNLIRPSLFCKRSKIRYSVIKQNNHKVKHLFSQGCEQNNIKFHVLFSGLTVKNLRIPSKIILFLNKKRKTRK